MDYVLSPGPRRGGTGPPVRCERWASWRRPAELSTTTGPGRPALLSRPCRDRPATGIPGQGQVRPAHSRRPGRAWSGRADPRCVVRVWRPRAGRTHAARPHLGQCWLVVGMLSPPAGPKWPTSECLMGHHHARCSRGALAEQGELARRTNWRCVARASARCWPVQCWPVQCWPAWARSHDPSLLSLVRGGASHSMTCQLRNQQMLVRLRCLKG